MDFQEILNQLEVQRKLIMKRIQYSIVISLIIMAISFIFGQEGLIFGAIISVIISFGLIFDSVNKYKLLFKSKFMPLVIAKTGMDLKYEYKSGIAEDVVMQSKLFRRPDRYFCEDLMYGTFEDVSFLTSDVHMQERHVTTDSKGHRQVHYETFFLGRWFIYDFNKEFNGIIQVREDGFFAGPKWGLNVSKIMMEDVEFNKKFKTYATNQHDAFYVLTPTLLENIKKLESSYPGRIYFSFIGSQLHIAVYNSKNAFEPPIWSPIDERFIDAQVADILILKDIVNELKLNRKIFKE